MLNDIFSQKRGIRLTASGPGCKQPKGQGTSNCVKHLLKCSKMIYDAIANIKIPSLVSEHAYPLTSLYNYSVEMSLGFDFLHVRMMPVYNLVKHPTPNSKLPISGDTGEYIAYVMWLSRWVENASKANDSQSVAFRNSHKINTCSLVCFVPSSRICLL